MERFPGKYLSLTSFRRDGSGVATPVWFVADNGQLVVETDADSYKVKRIRRDPHVRIAVCDARGRLRGEAVDAEATVLPDSERERVERLLARKYRIDRFTVLPLYRLVLRLRGRDSRTQQHPVAIAIAPIDGDAVPSRSGSRGKGRSDMTVLVAAASEHGGTAEIAASIGADLAAYGVDVDVRRLDEVDDIARYDAFVLGSGVYFGQWLREARRFIDDHAGELASRPTWLFSSGPIVGDPPPPDDPAALRAGLVERLVETTHARDHKLFGGRLAKNGLNWCERIAVRCAHASEAHHRDRAAVDEWAAEIARELEQS